MQGQAQPLNLPRHWRFHVLRIAKDVPRSGSDPAGLPVSRIYDALHVNDAPSAILRQREIVVATDPEGLINRNRYIQAIHNAICIQITSGLLTSRCSI